MTIDVRTKEQKRLDGDLECSSTKACEVMDREQQIKEMKKELCDVWIVDWEGNPHNLGEKLWDDDLENIAIELYNLGYRKQSEGEWVTKGDYLKILKCSACGCTADSIYAKTPYCPNCGAKMKGGTE